MRISEVLEDDDIILIFICLYLISFLAWKFFPSPPSVSRYLPIHESLEKSGIKGSTEDYPRTSPWESQSRGYQFLARAANENDRNYFNFAPCLKSQLLVCKYLQKIVEQGVSNYILTNSSENSQEISNSSLRRYKSDTCIKNHKSMESYLNKKSKDDSELNINLENTTQPKDETLTEKINSKSDVKNEENCNTPSRGRVDQFLDHVNETVLEYSNDNLKNEQQECQDIPCGYENTVTEPSDVKDCSQNKFDLHLAIEGSHINENSEEYSTKAEMKVKEGSVAKVNCLLTESSTIVLQQNYKSEIKSSCEKITFQTCRTKETNRNNENKTIQRNWSTVSFQDESHLKIDLKDKLAKRLTPTNEDTKICSRKEEDHSGEEFGVFPEKGANCMELISIMHSSKNATQSRNVEKEGEEEFGTSPVANLLKNEQQTKSTISLAQVKLESQGTEEERLDALFRRMLITEIEKHRKKDEAALKRVHSDSESVLPRKKSSIKNRAVLFNVKGQRLFQNTVKLDDSLHRGLEELSDDESKETDLLISIIEQQNSKISNAIDSTKYTSIPTTEETTSLTNSSKISCANNSNILLERKVNLPHVVVNSSKKLFGARNALETRKQECASKSTQTEHVYVIHAARSCPIRKRRLPLQMQLQRLASERGAVCSATVYASPDFSEFIFRKCSDNLIYEKGKGSRSPSFIPAPERFRWRYVMPNRIK